MLLNISRAPIRSPSRLNLPPVEAIVQFRGGDSHPVLRSQLVLEDKDTRTKGQVLRDHKGQKRDKGQRGMLSPGRGPKGVVVSLLA